ncbi:hypothetical protein KKG77_03500 [bacterium]|nr:hypothetical protein [bacterium]
MKLVLFPPYEKIENYLQSLYIFDTNCSYRLEVEMKSGITCNSNQNYQKKTLGEFPTSYLKIQITENKKLQYSYYRDLKEEVKVSDVERALKRINEDLLFLSK